jgi:glycosyltransferase involved in cell wall biosynthesis
MTTGGRESREVVNSLFVSCYNEEQVIGRTLDKVKAMVVALGEPTEVIVIDDASQDGSVAVLERYLAEGALDLRVFRNRRNVGLARNFFWAAKLARGRYFRLVWGGDVTPLASHLAIHGAAGRADIVIPDYSGATGGSLFRRALSRLFVALCNGASGLNVRYYNGGALFCREDVVDAEIRASGFGFQAELITALLQAGRSYVELPLQAVRDPVSSSVNWRNVLSVVHTLAKIVAWRLLRPTRTLDMPRICEEVSDPTDRGKPRDGQG